MTAISHEKPGELKGRVAFTTGGTTQQFEAGQLLFLTSQEPHALESLENASVLVTIPPG